MGLDKPYTDYKDISVVFFGSGPVAAASLKLLARSFTVEAIITKPTTVKEMSATLPGGCVYSVKNKTELDDLISAQQFSSKLAVLIDFGIIVSQKVIDYFPLGIVNSHFSILPEWRGADPITFAILSGQKMTGVSSMLLVEAMDEGPLLGYREQPIVDDETAESLTQKLINLSYGLLLNDIPALVAKNSSTGAPQDITGREVSYSRKLTKEDGVIDWSKPAQQIEREVRAFLTWPKSRTTLAGKDVVITKAHVVQASGEPETTSINGKELVVHCGEGSLVIDMLKPAGKNEMTSEAFLAGHKHLL